MLRVKEKVGVLPEVDTGKKLMYPSGNTGGVVRVDIDVDSASGTVRVVPSIVDSCLGVPGDALPAYRPSEIVYDGKRYVLREPLECDVTFESVDDESFYRIRCESYRLFASGDTFTEAVELFGFKFADAYEYLNAVHRDPAGHGVRGLGEGLELIRRGLNGLVVSVTPI
jgi:hypothetical protein